ncbi:hypothetical protein LEP3755_30630 [Leptolyngbya sp. NIES-3755]|nr:hypothetical protein LEP3755_30630 [Leptolyngbya sp. NIES-3755]
MHCLDIEMNFLYESRKFAGCSGAMQETVQEAGEAFNVKTLNS